MMILEEAKIKPCLSMLIKLKIKQKEEKTMSEIYKNVIKIGANI